MTFGFRSIIDKKRKFLVLSEIQEDYILCNPKDIPEDLQEAFIYKCILEKYHFLIQIIPNSLKVEPLSQREIKELLNKI